jgi:hypothetical protein
MWRIGFLGNICWMFVYTEMCFVLSCSPGIHLHGNVFVSAFPGNGSACHSTYLWLQEIKEFLVERIKSTVLLQIYLVLQIHYYYYYYYYCYFLLHKYDSAYFIGYMVIFSHCLHVRNFWYSKFHTRCIGIFMVYLRSKCHIPGWNFSFTISMKKPSLWYSGQSSWLQIQRSLVRFPSLSNFLRSSASGTGSIQPRENNWVATWMGK